MQCSLPEMLVAGPQLAASQYAGQRVICRPSTSARVERAHTCLPCALQTQQLPQTHIESSMKALDQMRRSSQLNRKPELCPRLELQGRVTSKCCISRCNWLTDHVLTGYAMEKKSSIIAIGLTIHQTPVQIREQLSIAEVRPHRQVVLQRVLLPHTPHS